MNLLSSLSEPAALPFADWMRAVQQKVEATLDRELPPPEAHPARLHEAMRYVTLSGGKRVRPLLAFAAGELSNAPPERLEMVACAVESIHAYSLVHDDLPCMDDDVLRRGRPACHVQYDEATALLVGDSLQSFAFELLAREDLGHPSRQLEMLRQLTHASGSYGMVGGQSIDLASVGQALGPLELEAMHARKTGALIRAAVLMGAACGEALTEEAYDALDCFAKHVGLLFQVMDDILDATADTATLGKTAGKDANAHKPTYVSLMGLDPARAFAAELKTQAFESLLIFGPRAQRLNELTDFILLRTF